MTAADFTKEEQPVTLKVAACPQCGLEVPGELDACPNDGTVMSRSPQELLGTKYEFVGLLGKGGMSVIYKARHKLISNKVVAIKLLQQKIVEDKTSYQRFKQEAEAASALDHPNLIKVLDFDLLRGGTTYLVMEYVEGQSLSDVIAKEGKLSAERALPLFKQIASGLAHAHSKGILHRDLKPSNVIVNEQQIKVVDFGIAKILDMPSSGDAVSESGNERNKLTATGEVFGSPLYMSPEQAMGHAVDRRSDIYSMGCLMYEALTGQPPFVGTNPIDTIFKHLNEPAQPIADHIAHRQAQQISNMVLRALEKDPAARYQTFAELIKDIQKIQGGGKISLRRRPSKRLIAAVAVTLSVVAIAYAAIQTARQFTTEVQGPVKTTELRSLKGKSYTDLTASDLLPKELQLLSAQRHRIQQLILRLNPKIDSDAVLSFVRFKSDPNLTRLCVDGTIVDDKLIQDISLFPSLRQLSFGNTKVTSRSFSHLAELPDLIELAIPDQDLTNEDIAALPSMPNLETIKLDGNPKLTDEATKLIIDRCPNIKRITYRDCPQITERTLEIIDQRGQPFFRYVAVYGTGIKRLDYPMKKGWMEWDEYNNHTKASSTIREERHPELNKQMPNYRKNSEYYFAAFPTHRPQERLPVDSSED